jgi:4-diphosphocytidyl-2-C-methyl-D-erythritol kinase
MSPSLQTKAFAKVNLTLRVLRQRPDGYHEIVSLVAFADIGDELTLVPGAKLDLHIGGPKASAFSEVSGNLILIAARELGKHVSELKGGRFELTKHLPVGAGLGGGSSDAAAALRLLAELNGLPLNDPRILAAAKETGADVTVCLEQKARVMSGIGEKLSPPLDLPELPCVILFPEVSLQTREVFEAFDELGVPSLSGKHGDHPADGAIPLERENFFAFLNSQTNDLVRATHQITPLVNAAEEELARTAGVKLVRMSGSGPSVFALYDTMAQADQAAATIRAKKGNWWVSATMLR